MSAEFTEYEDKASDNGCDKDNTHNAPACCSFDCYTECCSLAGSIVLGSYIDFIISAE